MKTVPSETSAARAISATVTASNPRSANSRQAASEIACRVFSFFRSRRPGCALIRGRASGVRTHVAAFAWHAWRRGDAALLDIRLFARRGFAAAAGTNLLVGIALFGALILLPLYFQLVRGETPLATGLLLVPQGLGAAVALPVAGRLTDEIGARVVIPFGVLLALAGMAVYTQVDTETSYWLLGASLFVIGLGLGTTIVPSMAVAYQAVPREAVAHATSTINPIQRIAGSVGTALLALILQRSISTGRAHTPSALAAAFGTTFWVAFGLVAAALVPALLLPRLRPRRQEQAAPVAS